jgi:hypothetical protein
LFGPAKRTAPSSRRMNSWAGVAESVDAGDLKSPAFGRAGSSPASGTTREAFGWFLMEYREASALLRTGDRNAPFPEGCFPPGLPFVGSAGGCRWKGPRGRQPYSLHRNCRRPRPCQGGVPGRIRSGDSPRRFGSPARLPEAHFGGLVLRRDFQRLASAVWRSGSASRDSLRPFGAPARLPETHFGRLVLRLDFPRLTSAVWCSGSTSGDSLRPFGSTTRLPETPFERSVLLPDFRSFSSAVRCSKRTSGAWTRGVSGISREVQGG